MVRAYSQSNSSMVALSTLNNVRWVVFYCFLLVIPVLLILSIVSYTNLSTSVDDVSETWKNKPIVSVYVLDNGYCAHGYEAIPMRNMITMVKEGPCGCALNDFGFQSSNASCGSRSGSLNVCMSLNQLPELATQRWRESIICVKRDEPPAATDHKLYKPRVHPNKNGFCPSGYKKCGEGKNQEEVAVCFPFMIQCPITNLLVLPFNQSLPVNEGWESAGTFSDSNYTLLVRRQYYNELPVVDISFGLTERAVDGGANVRGGCYEGEDQVINSPLIADSANLWSYTIDLPRACDRSDPRYVLVDQVPLQDHFLQNLQLTEPVCAEFSLYPLSDPRYQPALDSDYLNSGIKCDFTSKYTCVRDPYQRTDCAVNDSICDGVMNQNICGEYAHAVRAAFPESSEVTMGMYIQREVQWTDTCDVNKEDVYKVPECGEIFIWFEYAMLILFVCYNIAIYRSGKIEVRFVCDAAACMVLISILQVQQNSTSEIYWTYGALERNKFCSDLFTRNALMERLEPSLTLRLFNLIMIGVLGVIGADSILMAYFMGRDYVLCRSSTGRYYYVPNGTLLPSVDVEGIRMERVQRVSAAAPSERVSVTQAMSLEMGDAVRAF